MQPNVNVNLAQQICPSWCVSGVIRSRHSDKCPNASVLIPCPIPRSVTFTVALGECNETHSERRLIEASPLLRPHAETCPANPIRVSCSISGETWPDSDVTDVEFDVKDLPKSARWNQADAVVAAVRERWALVKALVLGQVAVMGSAQEAQVVSQLTLQRNAVYAALVKRVRAENAGDEALAEFLAAGLPPSVQADVGRLVPPRISEAALARYVEHLIEQVANSQGGL